MQRDGGHAVVIGASMAGLLAAAALAETYERVTVLDRDRLPEGVADRRAVPQGRHAHALLARGQWALEDLLPGSAAELVAAGAVPVRSLEELRLVLGGHELARASTGHATLFASRAFFEAHVRERVRALPAVTVRDGCAVQQLLLQEGAVGGVRLEDGEVLPAGLVVAATGRAPQVAAWLRAAGAPAPAERHHAVDVTYASCHVRLPEGALGDDRALLVGPVPGHARALFVFPQEGGRTILTTSSYGPAMAPPQDPGEHRAAAVAAAPPDVREALAAAEPTDDLVRFRFAGGVWRRFGRLPAGLVVCGDAVCAFNPTYGQGMSVAAASALALRDAAISGHRDLGRRARAGMTAVTAQAWDLSRAADLALPEVPGRGSPAVRATNRYVARLRATAARDATVAEAFADVIALRRPPRGLLAPRIVVRVARGPRVAAPARPAPAAVALQEP